MVRILANGDIVSDDDPRARSHNRGNPGSTLHQRGINAGIHTSNNGQNNAAPHQQISIFQGLNQRLLAFGIPRWNIGDNVIEPIVSVGLVLALVFFGLPGLLFGAILFAVSSWSQNGPPDFVAKLFGTQNQGRQNDRNQRGSGDGVGGYRLGHN